MSTRAFLLLYFCFGVLAALAWLAWHYRGIPLRDVIRGDFVRQQRESTPYGRVLYPLYVAMLIVGGAAVVGFIQHSARGAVGWAFALGPLLLVMYFLPRHSHS